jgi:hypothetical protein
LTEEFEEDLAVVVVVEDGSPLIAAGGDAMEAQAKSVRNALAIPEAPSGFAGGLQTLPPGAERALNLLVIVGDQIVSTHFAIACG